MCHPKKLDTEILICCDCRIGGLQSDFSLVRYNLAINLPSQSLCEKERMTSDRRSAAAAISLQLQIPSISSGGMRLLGLLHCPLPDCCCLVIEMMSYVLIAERANCHHKAVMCNDCTVFKLGCGADLACVNLNWNAR